jgi:hypothetical protein
MSHFRSFYVRAHEGRSLVALLVATLCFVATACSSGETELRHRTTTHGAQTIISSKAPLVDGYLASDEDADKDDTGDKSYDLKASAHDSFIPEGVGNKADQTDKRAITALIKRYYAAAASGDGAAACSLLSSSLVNGLAEGQEGPGHSQGMTCGIALSRLFKQQHALLAADDIATMSVIDVHVKRNLAIALVGFKTMPVGDIPLKREMSHWTINALLDTGTT